MDNISVRNTLTKIFQNAATAGNELTDLFKDLENRPDNVLQDAYKEMLAYFDLPATHPLARAGQEIARLIDTSQPVDGHATYSGQGNGYHNKNHMLEVMLSAAALLAMHEQKNYQPVLSDTDKLVLITAALAHDIGHNGKGNGKGPDRVPMCAEKYSVILARPIIQEKFEPEKQSEFAAIFPVFEALICSTDIGGGPASPGKFFADAAKFHRGERPELPKTPAPELESFASMLSHDPKLAEMSCLLQDADLFPSIGLTPEWAMKQEEGMGREDASRLTASGDVNWNGTLWFHNNLAAFKSQAGENFTANFEAIKSFAAQMQKNQNSSPGLG